jgi:uncharacterized protein (TIGR03437 family)
MLLAFGVGISIGPVQGQTMSFFHQFDTMGMDRATAVAADGSGVYVTGNRGFSQGGAVRKYDSQGNELWTQEFNVAARSVHFLGAAADGTGVYVAGYMRPVPLGDVTGQFVRKYSADGNQLWTSQLDFFPMGGVTVDASGVYVAGRDNPPNASYLRKYSPDGAQLWTRRFGEPNDHYNPHGIAADATGVYMVGMRFQDGLFPFARKWDPNGSELWSRQLDTVDAFIVAAADPTGFYVVGDLGGSPFLRRYDAGGTELWSRQVATAYALYPSDVAADATGVYISGTTSLARPALPGQCRSGSGSDSFVRKYDPDGGEVWTREFGTADAAWASSVAVDASGVYVVGRNGTAQVEESFYLGIFPTETSTDSAFLAKFDKSPAVVPESGPYIFPDCVVNAASYVGGGVAPGEIVTIFGSAMGPSELVPFQNVIEEDNGTYRLATLLADVRVLFDGLPAPLLYVSDKQSGAIVPYAVAGRSAIDVQVEYRGVLSDAVTVPVLPSRPGIFSLDASGHGQGAILNEDGSLNSPSNPALRGSVITIYGTGGGETAPGIVDGEVFFYNIPPTTSSPVSVFFNLNSDYDIPKRGEVLYAGGIAGSVAGLLQVNVRVPLDIVTGDAVPFALIIGPHWTVFQVTVAMR